MSITIDANMILFANRLNITSTRMVNDYGDSTIDEIIQSEAAQGNHKAIDYASDLYSSPLKLVEMFRLNSVENRYRLIVNMKESVRRLLLPMLSQDDLRMGLYFFTQEKLLSMLMEVDIEELVNVVREAFSIDEIVMQFTEEDLAGFFMNPEVDRALVMEQIQLMPPEILQQFVEGVTGAEYEESNYKSLMTSLQQLPDDKYREFMASIDPEVQRQLAYQLVTIQPEYLNMFKPEAYVAMLGKLMKPDMVKPMIALSKQSLVNILSDLPDDLMAIVGAQLDTDKLAKFLQHGHMEVIEKAMMI